MVFFTCSRMPETEMWGMWRWVRRILQRSGEVEQQCACPNATQSPQNGMWQVVVEVGDREPECGSRRVRDKYIVHSVMFVR